MHFEVTDNSDEVLRLLQAAKARALEKIGLTAEGYAVKMCPVDSGRLKNSITHTVEGDDAYIGSNVEYAA
jgi:phage gpG-like protein